MFRQSISFHVAQMIEIAYYNERTNNIGFFFRAVACFSLPCKIISFILTSVSFLGKIEPTKMTWLRMCGFIAQLVEHRTGIPGGEGVRIPLKP